MTIPIAPVAGLAAGLWEAGDILARGDITDRANWSKAAAVVIRNYTGYYVADGTWSGVGLAKGWTPLLCGFALHWVAGKIGLNRALGRAKIPVIRI